MKTKQAPSRPSLRAGATIGALLALTAACSGDMGTDFGATDGELEDYDSAVVDVDSGDELGPEGSLEKARFNNNLTYDGFNVGCTAAQKALINAADARAREILAIAMPATGEARVNRTTQKANIFRIYFVPNGNTNPDPNRRAPDEWDTAAFRVAQKLVKISQVLPTAMHTCHGGNESVGVFDGEYETCNQTLANAVTSFVSTNNEIRWCNLGLAGDVNERAVTLLHELAHQDRTADATGGHVYDDNRDGRLYNAHNYSSWFRNNAP